MPFANATNICVLVMLLGFDSLDYWNQSVNERVLHNEIKKMDAAAKSVLAQKLLAEAEESQ